MRFSGPVAERIMFLVSLSTMSTAQPRRFRVGVVSWGGATSMTAEAQAWESLCAQLRRDCARLTRNSHDAEDLAAGIVLELLRRAAATGEDVRNCGRGLAPLLLHRARGRWGNFRRDQRTRRAEADVALDDIPDRGISGDPLTRAERGELARSLAAVLWELPPLARSILRLRWSLSLSYPAIARRLSTTERIVRREHAKTLALLCTRLRGHGPEGV